MIKLPAYLTGFSSKSDGSASLRFTTQELTAEDFSDLKKGLNGFGTLLFKENEIKVEDIPTEDAEDYKEVLIPVSMYKRREKLFKELKVNIKK